ncbi:MAG TPA: twin-arginine translocase TatA/TatE family subunit [Dehalococcoidia bacterium]|nr:twin-arginine translocase TatA/TatE family subunit [Dehalococcoidia bacterium]
MDFFANPVHLILLIVVIVLLFGANKLGDVGGALGKSIREFKKEAGRDDEISAARKAAQTPPAGPTAGYSVPQPPVSGYAAAPQPPTPAYVPPAQAAPPVAPAAEPQRRMEYAPTEYRPETPQAPSASSNGTAPEYRGG